jgi:hypothetical protein
MWGFILLKDVWGTVLKQRTVWTVVDKHTKERRTTDVALPIFYDEKKAELWMLRAECKFGNEDVVDKGKAVI